MTAKRKDPEFLRFLEFDFPAYADDFDFYLEARAEKHGKRVNTENSLTLLKIKLWEWFVIGYDLVKILEHCTVPSDRDWETKSSA